MAIILTISALSIFSCATTARNFKHDNWRELKIGVTTLNETISRFGEPTLKVQGTYNGIRHDVFEWLYKDNEKPGSGFKSLRVEFVGNFVTGFLFFSSFSDSTTDFDISETDKIIEGKTHLNQIKKSLGEPSGNVIFPTHILSDEVNKMATINRSTNAILFAYKDKMATLFLDDRGFVVKKKVHK